MHLAELFLFQQFVGLVTDECSCSEDFSSEIYWLLLVFPSFQFGFWIKKLGDAFDVSQYLLCTLCFVHVIFWCFIGSPLHAE